MLGGKLAAEVVSERAAGVVSTKPLKVIQEHIIEKSKTFVAKDPLGVKGKGAIAFGGGAVLTSANRVELKEVDPAQFR